MCNRVMRRGLLGGYLAMGAMLASPACSSKRDYTSQEDGGAGKKAEPDAATKTSEMAGDASAVERGVTDAGRGGEGGGTAVGGFGGAAQGASGSSLGGSEAGGSAGPLLGSGGATTLASTPDAEAGAVDLCSPNPCENGGQCEPADGSCTCPSGYSGVHCETRSVSCSPNPCKNGGSCSLEQGSLVCACPEGFSGSRCQTNIDDCASKPCRNNGTCTDGVASYACACPTGYSGVSCEREVSTCSDAPCLNGGTCTNHATKGYTCACPTGFRGTNCETNIDDCAAAPCQNGAVCVDGVASYTCKCPTGFQGSRCETNIDDCASKPCQNGGTCVDGVASYICQCSSRYTGANCESLQFKVAGLMYGAGDTSVRGISGNGRVVVLNTMGDGEFVARMVDFGPLLEVDLGELKANGRHVGGVSRDGAVLGGEAMEGSGVWVPYWLNGATLRWLEMPVGTGGKITDVSADGSTLVGSWTDDTYVTHAFRFTSAGGVEYVSDLQSAEYLNDALAVSGDGSVIAGSAMSSGTYGRLWRWDARAKQTVNLELPSGWTSARLWDISTDGNVIVGEATVNGVWSAVRWVGASGKAEQVGTGALYGTNADGSVSVGADATSHAAVWTSSYQGRLVTDILGSNPDLAGVTLGNALAVSEDGKIVAGNASVTAGGKSTSQGWVARIR